jgi:hypothetical protein
MAFGVHPRARRPPTMTDHNLSPEHQALRDRIAEHVAAIHTASREFLESRRATNDAGPGRMLIAMGTRVSPPAADEDEDIDGRPRVENYCPEGTTPYFYTVDCGSDDPFACWDVICL